MLKKILTPILSTGLFVALNAGFNSCAPTAPNAPATTLISAPSSLTLSKTDSSKSSSIGLSCGCAFKLTVTGYGGDTSVIHFSFAEKLDSSITTHNVIAKITPSSLIGPHTDTAWIALYTPNDSTSTNPGTPLYDTLRVTASY